MFRQYLANYKSKLNKIGVAFAPANIALIKYWGKRETTLNIPVTNSLSIALGSLGATTSVEFNLTAKQDVVILNGELQAQDTSFVTRIVKFLDLVRNADEYFIVKTDINIPIAAGVASSAAGFAALALALNNLYGWDLNDQHLSILARLGSGSASRSIYQGFVEWQCGTQADGSDSFAVKLDVEWPQFEIGLLLITNAEKAVSSRQAMLATTTTCPWYKLWPDVVAIDLKNLKQALYERNFALVGLIAEQNAQAMHSMMQATRPTVMYTLPKTLELMHKVWSLRQQGIQVYFTQDAGPNLKLLYLQQDRHKILANFADLIVVARSEV